MSKGGDGMHLKGLAIAVGVGAAVGAVAILAMPKNNPTRRLAAKAADICRNPHRFPSSVAHFCEKQQKLTADFS